jgi:hypothetical protein
MVSAAGLLFNGIQAKNLHLSDRIRAMAAEARDQGTSPARRRAVMAQLPLFYRRIRLSQWSLDCLYLAILCFVLTSFVLASALWIGPRVLPTLVTAVFLGGVTVLILALLLEFVELGIALKTIEIEMHGAVAEAPDTPPKSRG